MSDTDVLSEYLKRDPGGQKTLLIKHLCPDMDQDLCPDMDQNSLMANLMNVCKIDVDEVYIMAESPGVALARFRKDIPDIQKLQNRVLDRGLNGVYPILTFLVQSIDDSCLAHCKNSSERQATASPLLLRPVVSPLMTTLGETETESIFSDDKFQDLCSKKCNPVTRDDMLADIYKKKETLQTDTRQSLEPTSTQSLQIGSIRLEIKKGRIAKVEADVLVNVVCPDGELVGSVSQAFIANGGLSFPVLYGSAKDADNSKLLVCTERSGRLKCSEVFHVRLQRQSPESIVKALTEIFLKCEAKGYLKLAMPPLGIGDMYDCSPDTVAQTMLKHLSQYGKKTDINMKIEIIIFDGDDETYQVFCDVFASSEIFHQHRQEPLRHETERDKSGLQNKSTHDDKLCSSRMPKDTQQPAVRFTRQTPSGRSESSFKGMYQQTQKSRGRSTQDGTPHRTERRQADSTSHQTHDLARNKNDHARKGHKEYIVSAKGHTQHRMNRNKEIDLRFDKDMFSRESDVPPFHHGKRLKQKFLAFVGQVPNFKKNEIPVKSPTYRDIVSMVESTFDSSKIGKGKDAVGLRELGYSKLHVMKIEKIENPELFEKYDGKRKDLIKQLTEAKVGNFPPIADLPGSSGKVQGQDYVQENIENDIRPQLNEMLLFHGTRSKYVDAICNEGPDSRLGCQEAMFGQGIYTAECSQKADQYADDPNKRSKKQKTMFLLRILLGNAFLCSAKDPPKYRRPPCTNIRCLRYDCFNISHSGKFGHSFHSVVGDTGGLFREFVVYEKASCYPEYLITYERR